MKNNLKQAISSLVKVKRHYQITLPGELRHKFNITEGDYMEIEHQKEGIFIRPVKVIHPDQEYFYTKEWQKGETAADKNLAAGRISGPFETAEDLINELDK